jgi:chaperone modulatory protein CbpM
MTTLAELLQVHRHLTVVHVERWVQLGLLRPMGDEPGWNFEDVDVARARLLAELTGDLGIDEDSLETVVDLLDQVHTLRHQLHQIGLAIGRQPVEAREAIAVALKDLRER